MATYTIPEIKVSVRTKGEASESIKCSADAVKILRKIYDADTFDWQEELILLCLNNSNKVIGFYKVSRGGLTGTIADPKVIFTVALNTPGTNGIILSHNHPSGSLKASDADIALTRKVQKGGELLDIKLLDHIIVTKSGYNSLSESGMM